MSDFAAIMEKANLAAVQAGDKWVAEHTKPVFEVRNADIFGNAYGPSLGTMLDVCGFAYVKITDKRTSFAKYIKKVQGDTYAVHFRNKHSGRQELGLREAVASAALKVLTDAGIKGLSFYSRID